MTHPYRSAGRSGAKLKFSKMLGTTKGAKHENDDSVVSPNTPVRNGVDDVKIMSQCGERRLDRKQGGRVAKKGVTINIIQPPSVGAPPPPVPPVPPGPPPGAVPPGGPPPMMPPRGPMPPGPGAGLPMPRARGGRCDMKKKRGGYIGGEPKDNQLKQWAKYARKNSYHKKDGGGINKPKLTGGADSGVGRLQHSKHQGKVILKGD